MRRARSLAPPEPARLPPMERVHDHAADALITLLTCDAADALVSACHDDEVRAAAEKLLRLLVERRDGRRR